MSRAGVTWELIKDYTPQYEYTDGFNVYAENLLPEFCIKATNADEATKKAEADSEHVYVYPVNGIKILMGILIVNISLLNIIK